jgi:D-alanyl-D-alanine carboxypeptidase
LIAGPAAPSEPIQVYTGPTRTGAALIAAVAADSEKQAPRHRGKKKSQMAAKKPDNATAPKAAAEDSGKDAAKGAKTQTAAKSAVVRHANAKPDAAPRADEKAAAATTKPAKPKATGNATGKATAKRSTKPAPKGTSDAAPANQKTATPRT